MYYYISLKWTHKQDAFITLWGPNSSGYQWYQSWIGKYDSAYTYDKDEYDVKSIPCSIADTLFEKVKFDGREVMILPNTPEVRKKLGITKKSLHKLYPSHCPTIKDLNNYKIAAEKAA